MDSFVSGEWQESVRLDFACNLETFPPLFTSSAKNFKNFCAAVSDHHADIKRNPMYIPKHFNVQDREQIEKFMADNPFAILITARNGDIAASHVPIRRFNDGKLYGHLARANPQAEIPAAEPVYVIFSGPHAYVTPTWYQSESNLPTWNYSAVHCRGKVAFIEDRQKVWSLLKEMVALFEGQTGWRLSEGKGHRRLISYIRFFEFVPDQFEAQFKFNQNKRSEDIDGVIEGLKSSGQPDVAEFMARITREK